MGKTKSKTAVRIGKFAIIGVILALFNFTIYTFLARVIMNSNELLWLDSLIACTLATILAYILHSKITWKERPVTKHGVIMFFIWNGIIALLISPFLTWLFGLITPVYIFVHDVFSAIHIPFDYNFVESTGIFCFTTAITMILNFIFYDKLVFGDQKTKETPKNLIIPEPSPLISIIVPVYNSSKYLKKCLDSIRNQSYKNLEIILVDDGSTDDSSKILKEYAKKDSRIKIVSQKNQGLSGARNTGILKSTGEYLTFVDSDDEITHDMIGKLFISLKNSDANISVCSFKEVYPNGKITHFSGNHPSKTYDTKNALKAMLKEQGFMLSTTMKLFPRSYFKNVKFPLGKLHEDVGTTYKLIMQATKVSFTPDELYIYHHHDDSIISTKSFDPRKMDIITLTDQMCDDINQKFPDLKNITNGRRMRARFSILRQMPLKDKEAKNILKYLKSHKSYITNNPEASKMDKLALRLALTSPKLFQIAYKIKKS